MRKLTCQVCGWEDKALTKRGAELKADVHRSKCVKPRRREHKTPKPSVDFDSGLQYLLCRYREHGCGWYKKFDVGQLMYAEQARKDHETSECMYR